MSLGRLRLELADRLAARVIDKLDPGVERILVVGSVRRRKPEVGDIEVIIAPRMHLDLFGGETPILEGIKRTLAGLGRLDKCGDRYAKVRDLFGHTGTSLDVFTVFPPAEWGSILAIRTGPADISTLAMMGLRARGYRHVDGRVVHADTGAYVPTPTEEVFFELAGIDFVPPEGRDELLRTIRQGRP